MGQIVLLALGAAFFPLLLACVAILIARPNPRRLLLAFYVGSLLMSLVAGFIVLSLFKDGHSAAGSTRSGPAAWVSIAEGVVALLLAWLLASSRGQRVLRDAKEHVPHRHAAVQESGPLKSSAVTERLDRATAPMAFAVGAVINLPGPFYLLALGDIAKGSYSTGQEIGLVLLFNAIMFILLEVPLVGYLVDPENTADRVDAMARWLNANGIRVIGAFVGVYGASLVVQGIGALL